MDCPRMVGGHSPSSYTSEIWMGRVAYPHHWVLRSNTSLRDALSTFETRPSNLCPSIHVTYNAMSTKSFACKTPCAYLANYYPVVWRALPSG